MFLDDTARWQHYTHLILDGRNVVDRFEHRYKRPRLDNGEHNNIEQRMEHHPDYRMDHNHHERLEYDKWLDTNDAKRLGHHRNNAKLDFHHRQRSVDGKHAEHWNNRQYESQRKHHDGTVSDW